MENINSDLTTPDYWSCNCDDDFVQIRALHKSCDQCGQTAEGSTDSLVRHVNSFLGPTCCESCGSTAITYSPGGTGYSSFFGEQDYPDSYTCNSCGFQNTI